MVSVKTLRRFGVDQWLRLFFILAFLGTTVLVFVGSIPILVRAETFAGVCAVILLAKRIRPVLFETPKPRVEVDHEGVRRVLGPKTMEQVRWDDMFKVSIMTTDEGPWVEDFFWLLHASDGSGCMVPQDEACRVDLLARLQRLQRFNNTAVIEANGSTSRGEFICWEGAPGEGIVARDPPCDQSRGSTGSLSSANTPKTHS